MGRSVNLINKDSATFFRGKAEWVIENGLVSLDRNETVVPGYSSLRVTPIESDQPVVFKYNNVFVDQVFEGDSVQFHCRVKTVVGSITRVSLTNSNSDLVERDTGTGFNSWGICRSDLFPVPDIGQNIFVNIEVKVFEHLGNDVFFTAPFIYITDNILRDLYVLETFINLPSVIREADINHASDHGLPDFPLTRFIELPGNFAGDVTSDYYSYEYISIPDGKNINDPGTLSEFVEPLVARPKFIPWLSQLVGVYLDDPTTGKTPWENIPSQWTPIQQNIDPAENPVYNPTDLQRSSNVVTATIGSHVITSGQWVTVSGTDALGNSFNGSFQVTSTTGTSISWSQTGVDESATILGSLILLDTEWQELENFNPALDGLLDYLRWQVKYSYNGLNAGTYAAVVNATKRVLTGDKKVTLEYFYEGNPWQIIVRTRTSESPDGVSSDLPPANGTQSFTIYENIRKVKPAGYRIIHECTATGE